MKLPVIDQVEVDGKRVFIRGDIDIPLTGGKIVDETRLLDIWPTLEFLLKKDCLVFLGGHLGRPGGKEVTTLSSQPVAEWLAQKVGGSVSGVCLKGDICGFLVNDKLTVLENLRFDPREEASDEVYAQELASLADVYVDEAFGACYENHTSLALIPNFLPHFAGLRLAKEVEKLSAVLENPRRPVLVIIGGAKTESKVPVIAGIQKLADRILLGGKIVVDVFSYAREHKMNLDPEKVTALPLTADFKDIFAQAIANMAPDFINAGTIVWNGPFGAVEEEGSQLGTRMVADLILGNPRAYKVVGGGDTVAFLDKLKVTNKFDWVSSGGGSMLKFLAGEKLPGIEALR